MTTQKEMNQEQRQILRELAGGARLVSVIGSPKCYVLGEHVYRPVDIDDCAALDDLGFIQYQTMIPTAAYSTISPAGIAALS